VQLVPISGPAAPMRRLGEVAGLNLSARGRGAGGTARHGPRDRGRRGRLSARARDLPKIERELHLALMAFLSAAAAEA